MYRSFSLRLGWLFAAGLVAIPVHQVTANLTREFDETYRVGAERRLVLEVVDAEVVVTAGEEDTIRLQMVWDARTDRAKKAEERFDRLRFTAREETDATVLKLETRGRGWSWFQRGSRTVPKVTIRLIVPAQLHLDLDTTSGSITVSSVHGDHRLDSVSADLKLEDCAGDLRADSTSGRISLLRCPGNHRLESVSGDLRVEDGRGNVVAETESGDIRILAFPGSHRAESVSGSIQASLAPELETDLRFEAVSGDLLILVPSGLEALFDLETISGSLRCEVPGAEVLSQDRRTLRAKLGEGTREVRFETISGNITVRNEAQRG
jgi:hypothetical protein